jgi:type II secretory pathway component GspD/PulD (secretin)
MGRAGDWRRRVWLAGAVGACFGVMGCTQMDKPREPATRPVITEIQSPTTAPSLPVAVEITSLPPVRPTTVPVATVIAGAERSTLLYPCKEARPETLAEAVQGLLGPQGTAQPSAALNTVVVVDAPETVVAIQKAMEEMDHNTAQLLIEARVVEIKLDSDLETEIEHLLNIADTNNGVVRSSSVALKTPGGSPQNDQGANLALRPWSSDGSNFETFVRLLVTRGKAKILSSPNLIVSPGTEGSIITGQEVPVQSATVVSGSVNTTTLFKRVGIKLRVNLQQIAGDSARVEINPEVSSVIGYTEITKEGITNPIIAIRNVSSTLTLKDGEVLTVGGLLQTEDTQVIRGVPLLSDIPILGVLFQSRRNQQSKTQLVFFMRARILPAGQVGAVRVHKPGVGLEQLDKQLDLNVPQGNGGYPVSAEEMLNLKKKEGQ